VVTARRSRKVIEASIGQDESEQYELSRLRREQAKTRHDEVFGGLTPAERSAYDIKQVRIRQLERRLSGQLLWQGESEFVV
jgi:hypothetical protein